MIGRKVWKQLLKFFSLPAFREENLVKLRRVFKFSLTRKCLVYFISVQITKSLTLKCTFACCSFFWLLHISLESNPSITFLKTPLKKQIGTRLVFGEKT